MNLVEVTLWENYERVSLELRGNVVISATKNGEIVDMSNLKEAVFHIDRRPFYWTNLHNPYRVNGVSYRFIEDAVKAAKEIA